MNIPLSDLKSQYKSIKNEIDQKIAEVLENSEFILGGNVEKFEEEFANFCGVKYGVGVGNGTDALYLALRACGIKEGDEVITVPNTFIATVEAITLNGAKPVFVDIDPETQNMDAEKMRAAITAKTKAVIPVHLFGQPVEMDSILKIAKERNLFVIEDVAQAHGAKYNGKAAGSMGAAGCFSFFPAKNLGAYGDGGMIVTDDENLAKRLSMMRNHGRLEKYTHEFEGKNSRLDEIQAAVLRVKLKYLDKWNEARRQNALAYDNLLKDVKGVKIPQNIKGAVPVYYFYVIRAEKRDELQKALKEKGISTGIHYPIPLHLQPAYQYLGHKKGDFPETEKAADEILSLPICPELAKEQIEYIAREIKNFYEQK